MSAPTEQLVPGLDELDRPLNDRERRRWLLKPALGTPFDDSDRLFPSFEQTGVYDTGQEDARDLKQMLRRDGRVRQLENVLTLPIRAATPEIREKKGSGRAGKKAADLCREQLDKHMQRLVAQGSAAMIFRKTFFELEWTPTSDGVGFRDIAWRPPATCQARFDPRSGKPAGFRQQVVTPDGKLLVSVGDEQPGWKVVPQPRALIFTHGTHREPITGTSELDVAYWCWESRQKVLYLLFKFLESNALPKVIAEGPDAATAQANADFMAEAINSSVIPVIRRNGAPGSSDGNPFHVLESSGSGSAQFLEAIRYLEEQQVASVLAGFLNLTETDKSGGSFALSTDARQFFLQSRQADADEQAGQIASEACRPLTAYNFGDPDLTPTVHIGPLSQTETGRALEMLKPLATASTINVPDEYVDELVVTTSKHVGMDPDEVRRFVEAHAEQRAEQKAQQALAGPAGQDPGAPSPAPGADPKDPAQQRRAVGQGTDAAFELVRRVDLGQDPHDALRVVTGARHRGPNPGGTMPTIARHDDPAVELARTAEHPDRERSGWVGLYPNAATRDALHVDHANAAPADDLHLTLLYIGSDVTWWDQQRVEDIRKDVARLARGFEGPVTAKAWAHALFNPDGEKPCAVYLIGQATSPREDNEVERERRAAQREGRSDPVPLRSSGRFADPLQRAHDMLDNDAHHRLGEHAIDQHVPYVPHTTAGYGVAPSDLEYTGPVVFDTLSLHLAGERWDFPLVDPGPDGYPPDDDE